MITFEEAREIVSSQQPNLNMERIGFRQALYRILAEDIYSDRDMPPFHKSAMDGFACRMTDIGSPMKVIDNVPAGKMSKLGVGPGECVRIMTGAPVPEGADCVVMIEHTEPIDEVHIRYKGEKTERNICYQGEDVQAGQLVLRRGTRLLAPHIAVLASLGAVEPSVYVRPRIGILSSGDELVEPDMQPGPSGIRNSNAYQLEAQVMACGAIPVYKGIIPDEIGASVSMISEALATTDMILITGGVSSGDLDLIPAAMEKAGIEVYFSSLAVQPGRPTVFGRWKQVYVFGLPGNPVSSLVQFELLVKPLIYKIMGHAYAPSQPLLSLGESISRKKAVRKSFIPVKVGEDGFAVPVPYHGSAHIHAYLEAQALINLDIGQYDLEKGVPTRARFL